MLIFHYHAQLFDHLLTDVPGVGSSPTGGTFEKSQVLLAGVPGVFFFFGGGGSPVFAPP